MFEVQFVVVGGVDRALVEFLEVSLRDLLGVRTSIRAGILDPAEAFDPRRRQYGSTRILERLLSLRPTADVKLLGVTELDLFIPIFTFVFGEAQLLGPTALFSTCRLRPEYYGEAADEDLLFRRAEKEAIHELGHAFGLVHCRNLPCVMYFSNSIEEVDLKSSAFCEECAFLWRRAVEGDRDGVESPPPLEG